MGTTNRSGLAALALVVATVGAANADGASAGAARAERTPTTIRVIGSQVDAGVVTLRGTVDSPRRACEKRRLVVVRAMGGREVGRDRADKFGRWHVRFPASDALPGRYDAAAPRVRVRSGRVVCGGDRTTATVGAG